MKTEIRKNWKLIGSLFKERTQNNPKKAIVQLVNNRKKQLIKDFH
jgi:hypothetical protein